MSEIEFLIERDPREAFLAEAECSPKEIQAYLHQEPVCAGCEQHATACDCEAFAPLQAGQISYIERMRRAGIAHRGFHPPGFDLDGCEACRKAAAHV